MVSGINFKLALKRLDISQQKAADLIGKSRQTIVTWVGKSELDSEIIELINDKLNIDLSQFDPKVDIIKPKGSMTQILKNPNHNNGLIPFYNADFMAGRSDAFYNDGVDHPDYYMDVPEFSGCIAFRAFGDSMEKIIKSSSVLFGFKMDDDWRDTLEYGQIYGITLKNGLRYLKYIRKATDHKNYFLLKSENEKYDDFEIKKDKIKNLWLIQGWIDKRA